MHKEVFESLAFFSQSFRKIESYEGIAWKKILKPIIPTAHFFLPHLSAPQNEGASMLGKKKKQWCTNTHVVLSHHQHNKLINNFTTRPTFLLLSAWFYLWEKHVLARLLLCIFKRGLWRSVGKHSHTAFLVCIYKTKVGTRPNLSLCAKLQMHRSTYLNCIHLHVDTFWLEGSEMVKTMGQERRRIWRCHCYGL